MNPAQVTTLSKLKEQENQIIADIQKTFTSGDGFRYDELREQLDKVRSQIYQETGNNLSYQMLQEK